MRSILLSVFVLAVVGASVCLAGDEKETGEFSSEGFKITQVMNEPKRLNALGKMAELSDSEEIGRDSDLPKKLYPENRGEEFIVMWRYSGSGKKLDATVKVEYVTGRKTKVNVYEKAYRDIGRSGHTIVLRNVGKNFEKNGEIAHWRVSIYTGDKVVASKQSAMWEAFEEYAKRFEGED